ncbi:MAG: hydroxyacid dehydrogenase [Clostridiales bacterium]|jgi:phosphoglycerate dehydrogenase-like enzyme|nr:hydroxyacid dehydrogenase [Clostridiales bacterium]
MERVKRQMKKKGLYVLDKNSYNLIYGSAERKDIENLVEIIAPVQDRSVVEKNPEILKDVEIIFSGWGSPKIDEKVLAAAPNLEMVFYGAGSIKGIVTEAFWDRGIRITSAYAANGIPVAEYTLSQILFSLKRGWHFALSIKNQAQYPSKIEGIIGAYGSTVGIISLGMIGRYVCNLLKPFDIQVIAYDPYASNELAMELNVELCSLDEIFQRSHVVSLHTPWLPETEGMITGRHFSLMKKYATFINTARGAVVREDEMIEVLRTRQDLQAVLDVTWPEPPDPNSPLYTLPNIVLTPHIAGSLGKECNRMGRYMVEELERYLKGDELKWEITRDKAAILA